LTLDDMFVKDVENQTRQHPLYIGQQRWKCCNNTWWNDMEFEKVKHFLNNKIFKRKKHHLKILKSICRNENTFLKMNFIISKAGLFFPSSLSFLVLSNEKLNNMH
jgi:hypothetical protein